MSRDDFAALFFLLLAVATVVCAIGWEGDHQALLSGRQILAHLRASNPKMAIPEP